MKPQTKKQIMKTYRTYNELETELNNDNDVQSFSGLTQAYDEYYNEIQNVYTVVLNTKYGTETRKVEVLCAE